MTSITLDPAVKAAFQEQKPEVLGWSEFLQLVWSVLDKKALEGLVEKALADQFSRTIQEAESRLDDASKPGEFVGFAEARALLASKKMLKANDRKYEQLAARLRKDSEAQEALEEWWTHRAFRSPLFGAGEEEERMASRQSLLGPGTPLREAGKIKVEIDLGRVFQETMRMEIRSELEAFARWLGKPAPDVRRFLEQRPV